MNRQDEKQKKEKSQSALNLALAAVAGQVGFVTLGIIAVALIGGLALDNQFGTKPMFTILLMIASVPVTVVLMFRIVRAATSQIKPSVNSETTTEENNRE
ncbi:MAG: AtpZ/AtpI family protein [Anaerolineaceae bacterium]|jgi:F0F1-type ATP synthase assembly protein I|nr:MAG: AtpZ/AtpI family protein [Anaerolineaceae bacterium]